MKKKMKFASSAVLLLKIQKVASKHQAGKITIT